MAGLISGEEIQNILNSRGPVVKCVLLRAAPENGDAKPAAKDDDAKKPAATKEDKPETEEKVILKDLIDEIEVDTTPKKSMVQQIMGGPITFLGQYEDEDLVLVCRRPETLDEETTPWNPHTLQPPFENTRVQGNILIMRVAKEEEKLEHEADGTDKPIGNPNDDFFLDFTKDDYIQFALRDDVEPPEFNEEEQVEDEEEEELEEEDEDEEEFIGEDDDDEDGDDEDAQVAMMNLIMGQVLRRFHEENGRGPDTRELLELRSALAQKLGVELPEVVGAASDDADESDGKPSAVAGKRTADEGDGGEEDDAGDDHEAKRVKFSQEATADEEKAPDEKQEGEI